MNFGYGTCIGLQFLFIVLDAVLNSYVILGLYFFEVLTSLFIIVIQVLCQVLAVIILVLSFFSANTVQAGLFYQKFKKYLILSSLYIMSTVALNGWIITGRRSNLQLHLWSDGLLAFFVMQKLIAVCYYYNYKRSILRLFDPEFSR